CQQDYSSPYTF
nr:immunoglobulin light chain junction region [Mus musculus]NSM02370.1 immunoglobulin light chain junction region [Mus musculus]